MRVATVRQFRDRASEMFRSDDVILVTRDGVPAGFFLPWDAPDLPVAIRREVFQRLSDDAGRRQHGLAAAEEERARWARELHDETLQGLAAVRVLLAAPLRGGDRQVVVDAVRTAAEELERQMATLRDLITDLRPAALDQLGTEAAIEGLAERARSRGLDVELTIDLAYEQGREAERHTGEIETALYRIVQEGLNNVQKHGAAQRVSIAVEELQGTIVVTVSDDGRGFDPTTPSKGFGLIGMRERTELAGGRLEIDSASGQGTVLRASFPAKRRTN